MTIHFYTTITQDTSVYQNIGVTWNFNRNVIVDVTDNVFIIWPISQYYFISSIQNCGSNISLIVIKVKITVLSYNVCCQVKIDSTLTALARFMFNNKKFFTIEFTTYLLT